MLIGRTPLTMREGEQYVIDDELEGDLTGLTVTFAAAPRKTPFDEVPVYSHAMTLGAVIDPTTDARTPVQLIFNVGDVALFEAGVTYWYRITTGPDNVATAWGPLEISRRWS
jgi:hypothetical protein